MSGVTPAFGRCGNCNRVVAMYPRGVLHEHLTTRPGGPRCDGSYREPLVANVPKPVKQPRTPRPRDTGRDLWYEDIIGEPRL